MNDETINTNPRSSQIHTFRIGLSIFGLILLLLTAAATIQAMGGETTIAVGYRHACGIQTDGTINCWGLDSSGQSTPPTGTFSQVSAGGYHSCAVQTDGAVACWGSDEDGQSTPPTGTFSQVSAGGFHSCGLQTDGTINCWGDNSNGQATPPTGSFTQVSAGYYHSCGLQTDGAITCWGLDTDGQSSPPTNTFTYLSTGGLHTCGILTDGTVSCWGLDNYGQSTSPAGTFTQIGSGGWHTCGVQTDGTTTCWGYDPDGRSTPPETTYSQVGAGGWFGCGLEADGTVSCWGNNSDGQSAPPSTTFAVDATAPTVVTQDITIQLDAVGNASIIGADVDNGTTDDANLASLTVSPNSFTCSNVGDNVVILTATDTSGLSATGSATVTVEDTTVPSAVAQNITVQLDVDGNATITANDVDNGSNDACGLSSLSIDTASFTMADLGANSVTLTVTDNNGNVETAVSTVTIEDNIPPTAVCQDISLPLDGTGNASITGADIDNGSSDAAGIASLSAAPNSFTSADIGDNTITLTVTDNNGNSSNCNATVTVFDPTPPTVITQDHTVQLDATGNATISASDVDNGSYDNVAIDTMSVAPNSFTCAEVGDNTVTLTVTDNNGTSATGNATVTVQDAILPTAIAQDITVQLDAGGSATITASDINNGSSDACGISSNAIDTSSFTTANVGSNSVTLTVTDNNGNVNTAAATVTVEDNVAPTAVCQDITVSLDGSGNATITGADIDNGSSDASGIASLSAAPNSFTAADMGDNTVTLTVTDNNSNSSNCNATVTIADTTPPTVITQTHTVQLDATGNATITASDINNGSSDNVAIDTLSAAPTSFTCAEVGDNTVGLTATDTSGNSASGNTTVTVQDLLAPSAVAQDITVQLDATGNATITANDINNGSSDACGISSLSIDKASFTMADLGDNNVTLSVTDNNGNVNTAAATVTVEDNIAPAAVCQDISVPLDGTGNASITAADIDNGSSDAAGIASMSVSPSSFTTAEFGDNAVTLTVTDNNGNSSNCNATVTVTDPNPPTVVTKDHTVQLDAGGNATISAGDVNNGSSDDVAIDTLSVSPSAFTCANVGSNTVTLTVTDTSGNSANGTATVTVEDVTIPTAIAQNLTVQLDGSGNATITASDINNGSSDACGLSSISIDKSSFTMADLGDNTVTLTVTDNNGNVSTAAATVTIQDNIAPTAVCQDITVSLDGSGNATITAADIDNGSSDAAGIASMSVSPSSFTAAELGDNSVTLTVTDNNGNSSNCNATVTITDTTAPTVVTKDHTVQLDASGSITITVSDINNGSSDNVAIDTMSVAPSSFTCAEVGDNTVTLTITDTVGNAANATATVTVQDLLAPLAIAQDITIQLDGTGNATITAGDINNGSNDICGISSLSIDKASFTAADLGDNTVTLTVTDNNGNVNTAAATVTVEDNIAPTVVTKDHTVQLDASGNATITASDINNGSSDNVAIDTMSVSPSSFTCAAIGDNTVTLTVTDVNGNSANGTATVTVQDITLPAAIAQNLTVQLDANGNATITASDINNGSSDACGLSSLSIDKASFTMTDLGDNTVTLTVTDNNGNVSTAAATVTVEDNVAPTAVCQDISVALDGTGNASITAADIDNGSSDAAGIASLSVSPSSFTTANVGDNTVTLTVIDNNGNSSNCNATVTITDPNPPTVVTQDHTVQLDASGNATISASDVNDGSSDDVAIDSMSVSPSTFTCAEVGSNTVTLTVIDTGGNSATGTATVTVEDVTLPAAIAQNLTIQLDASGNATLTAADVNNGSNDACGISSVSIDKTSFTMADLGDNIVTLTVTDNNGNVNTAAATITVEDNIAPAAVCQDISVALDGTGNATITAAEIDNGSSDAAGIASMSVSPSSFTTANVGDNSVTLTVFDNNGNSSSCNATVTVTDPNPPTVVTKDHTVQLDAGGNATITASDVNDGSSDDVAVDSMSVSPSSFTCAEVGSNSVTLTVIDTSGNSANGTATVTVQDVTLPAAIAQNLTVQLDGTGNAAIIASDVNNGSSDACGIGSLAIDKTSFTMADLGDNTVTLTVTDNNGNVSTAAATVTVEDNVAPAAVCQDISVALDGTGNATITASDVDNGSSDAAGIASMSVTPSSFTTANVGDNTVALTVTDNNGNSSSCNATVTITDPNAPTVVTKDHTVQLDAAGNAAIVATDVNNGSSDDVAIDSMSVSPSTFTCANVGSNSVTLTVTDTSGNSATGTATVTVEDVTLPTALANNITVELDHSGNAAITAGDVDAGSSDACGIANMSVSPSSFTTADRGANSVTLTITDNNGNMNTASATVTVNIPATTVAIDDVTLAEGDAPDTTNFIFTVTRTHNLVDFTVDFVTVDGTAVSPTDYIHTTGTITFTASGSLTQTVTIPVVGDFSDESDELFNLVLSNIQAGGEDVSFTDDTADGNIQDDDGAGVTMTNPGDAINITEGGTTDSFSIVLDSQPTDVVTMTIATDDQVDLGSGAGISITLTFTSANWDDAQSVTVTAVNDASAEGLHSSSIAISSTSSDADYEGFTANLTATITDNDSPGVTITESGSSTAVSESGPSDSYEVVLATMPTDNVDVLVTPDDQIDLGNGAGNPVTLTFTPANWDDAQVVTITAVNDNIDENNHNSIITHSATSSDADYEGVSIVNVTLIVSDNDIAGVTITEPGGGTSVDESGTADAINVVLDSQPTANVTVTLTPDAQVDLGNGAGNPITLTFTPANWDDVQSVTVTAVDDDRNEGTHSSVISYTVSSGDAFYDGMSASDTTIEIIDNDEATDYFIFLPIITSGN